MGASRLVPALATNTARAEATSVLDVSTPAATALKEPARERTGAASGSTRTSSLSADHCHQQTSEPEILRVSVGWARGGAVSPL
jgi:hypothetical protein